MIRKGELRVQVDRWPVTDSKQTPYVLTVVVVGSYKSKPDIGAIQQALRDAIDILGANNQKEPFNHG